FDRLRQFVTKNVARLEMREKVSQTSESLRSMRKSTKRATAAVILLAGISGILIGNNGEADETPTERHVEEQAVVNPALVGKLPKPFTNHSDAPSVSPEITTSETRDNQASNDNLLNDDSLYKSLYANPVETAFNIESLPKDLLPSTLINQITEKFHIDYDFLMSESLRHFSVQMEQQYSLKPDSMIWVQGRIINPTENAAFIKTIVKTASQLVVA
ncbi:MAG TPA: hypothetical protein PKD20_00825, partial [Candidatus Saccharibacteria bacterium]|nr:hypothetical protein [Candidatus Saccharibacteria bacterium]